MQINRGKGKESREEGGFRYAGIDMGGLPSIEMLGNRRVTIEGSTGILLYESENIKINTPKTVISFCGRGLTVRCISSSCVEVEGFITIIEFLT